MASVLNRATKEYLASANTPDFPVSDWIINPDLSAVRGFDLRYWVISGDAVSLMSPAERDALDAARETSRLDALAAEIEQQQTIMRAFAEVLLDELNRHALKMNALLDGIDGASNLAGMKAAAGAITDHPTRTLRELRDGIRSKL